MAIISVDLHMCHHLEKGTSWEKELDEELSILSVCDSGSSTCPHVIFVFATAKFSGLVAGMFPELYLVDVRSQ